MCRVAPAFFQDSFSTACSRCGPLCTRDVCYSPRAPSPPPQSCNCEHGWEVLPSFDEVPPRYRMHPPDLEVLPSFDEVSPSFEKDWPYQRLARQIVAMRWPRASGYQPECLESRPWMRTCRCTPLQDLFNPRAMSWSVVQITQHFFR